MRNLVIPSIPDSKDFLFSHHCRKRVIQRKFSKVELYPAHKFGEKSPSQPCPQTGAKRWKYSYQGVTFVTNENSIIGLTSWANPCWGIDLPKVNISQKMADDHDEALFFTDKTSWNSHSVVIIDQSGSMRETDTCSNVTRSDMAWLSLALDYVGKQLQSGEKTNKDYFSLIVLSEFGDVILEHHPMNWLLYNRIIDFMRKMQPLGCGNYLPALDKASELLMSNKSGNCALQLVFLSDGSPSDDTPSSFEATTHYKTEEYHRHAVSEKVAFLASKFGSRLSICVLAVGDERFHVMEGMIRTGNKYNCKTHYMSSSLKIADLSSAFCSISSILTSTKDTMTEFGTKSQRTCRDLTRLPSDKAFDDWNEPLSSLDIYIFKHYKNGV